MKWFWSLLPVMMLAALLTGCDKDVAPPPVKLPDLPKQTLRYKQLWSVKVGKGLDEQFLRLRPALTDSTVFAASRDGVVVAVDRASGKVRWERQTDYPFTGGAAVGYGLLLVGTAKGELVAMSVEDGRTLWRASVTAAVLSAAAVSADHVVVQCSDGKIYGLDREKGYRLWTHDTVMPTLSLRGNAPPVIVNDMVYVGTAGGKIEALNLADGTPQWDLRVSTNQGRSELEQMVDVDGDMVLDMLAGQETLFSVGFQGQITAIDLGEGKAVWDKPFDLSSYLGLATGLGNIYAVDSGDTIYAIDEHSGKPVWKQPALAYRKLSSPVVLGNNVLVGDYEGYVHAFAEDGGHLQGRFRPSHKRVAALLSDQGTVYVYDVDGKLSAWQENTGSHWWPW